MAQMTTTEVRTQGFYLSGKWLEEGTPVEIRAPYDGTPLAQIFQGTREHAERAIQGAVRAFGSTRRLPAFERQRVLRSIAQHITSRKEEFARTLAQEAGKPLKAARIEVERGIFTLTVAAGLLVTDGRVKLTSFTGSAAVGWEVKRRAGKKKVVLELGGSAGVIVHGDADIAWAAERCVTGGFSYAGQTCISVQRILIERPAVTKFRDLFLSGVSKLKIGDPMDDTTDLGPLIRESDAIRATEWVQEAVQDGATLLAGGKRRGSVMEPTVLTGTRTDMKVNCQEIFAPVVTLEPY